MKDLTMHLLPILMAAAAAVNPVHYVLETDTSVWDVAVQDINGDGIHDILAICSDEDSHPLRKFVAVFLGDEHGGYPSTPSFIQPLSPSIGAIFFAETTGAPPIEMVATDARGATVYGYRDGALTEIQRADFLSLLPDGSKEPLFFKEPMEDLTGDGIAEWIVPVPSGYQVRTPTEAITTISCDVVSEIRNDSSMVITHRLPAYTIFDLPGQSQKAIAFLSDEFADFAYGPRWEQRARFKVPLNLEEKWEASAKMTDINGNGLPDLVVTQVKGTVNLKVLTQIYLATEPFTYPEIPTATFEVDGSITSPILEDVNGDGRLDLMFIGIPFSVKNLVSYLVRKRITIAVDVHLFDGTTFPASPTHHTKLTLDAPEGRERVAYTLGDFNGDGLLDIAVGQGSESLAIYFGRPDRFVPSRADMVLKLPAFGVARPHDIDGNGSDDIVIYHPSGQNRKRIEVLIF
jgi:hypothetical protein